ncbi:MAG: pyruvate, phosphate dikinase [Candidatus Delongbacteria bacterium]|nr:pyruvate, phosphate dikinase [Candidatus Delongbacteria bacterium]MCG2760614.1 pyruvate, phosphate dikinase [Candidatus Delongbacteria bacterium]
MIKKFVYNFCEGDASMKELLGGKGANLAEMTKLGIPVPPGFTISTEACQDYYKDGKKQMSSEIIEEYKSHLKDIEKKTGKKFGDDEDPLLLSVRSGAAASMPGMMDTVLNLGLNDISVQGIIKKTGNERFGYDSYRRFIQMFGGVVLGISGDIFENELHAVKEAKKVEYDTDLSADDLKEVIARYKKAVEKAKGKQFPQDPHEQLQMSIEAVFGSWNNKRAVLYRKLNDLKGLTGTAVNIQVMVYGNKGETSGTGVCFTRNPSTGENLFYGEYLMNAQGEDVVAGIRTPKMISTLNEQNEAIYNELVSYRNGLEKHYKNMQDMEFTIEEGKLWMLQTRTGKRTAAAAVKMAVDMCEEGLIDKETAVLRVKPSQLDQLLHPQLDLKVVKSMKPLAKGLPASPGAAVGKIVFDAHEAHDRNEEGEKVILVRNETSPEDLIGMNASEGILTARGGMTSHAAVVARGMGKCCVAGCSSAKINEAAKTLTFGDKIFTDGDVITLNGSEGTVYEGAIPVVEPELSEDFGKLMDWADEFKKLIIKTNADTPHDTATAVKFGAEGIGLCRTEHMFFEATRIKAVREMIVAKATPEREKALAKIEPFQQKDFEDMFKVLEGKPMIIRLLDPPLHEFLPKEEEDIIGVAKEINVTVEQLKSTIDSLHEFNPMLGFRGCRLAVVYPEIARMQVRAIFKAALNVKDSKPWIEVPLTGILKEYMLIKEIVEEIAVQLGAKGKVDYRVGTMIEVPRAALTADEFAPECDFMSFGTNDLTQMTCGFSRDDAGSFLGKYVDLGIYDKDPFQTIDRDGVGKLMYHCVMVAKEVNPKIHIGICGEHGGDPDSVEFCHQIGLDEVSCSPYRVPIARLAAAHAAINFPIDKECGCGGDHEHGNCDCEDDGEDDCGCGHDHKH